MSFGGSGFSVLGLYVSCCFWFLKIFVNLKQFSAAHSDYPVSPSSGLKFSQSHSAYIPDPPDVCVLPC